MSRPALATLAAVAVLLALAGLAQAQSPFGVSTPDTGGGSFGGPLGPFFAWVAGYQQAFYRDLTAALGQMKESGSAAWLLMGLSFLYGIFHAAGPGHGKAVISSYLIANNESARRGIVISFAAAFVQAGTAILVVGIAAALLNVTAMTMTEATNWLEIGSYALVVAIGLWLLWSKTFGGGHHHHHHGDLGEHQHGDGHHHHDRHAHDHNHDHHDHGHHHDDACCSHHAGPIAAPMTGNPIAQAWTAILSVGIRPCSGAIIVLVFALSQGLFAAGVAATLAMALGTGITVTALAIIAVSAKDLALRLAGGESDRGHKILRGIEIAGALVILLIGLTLLGGALSAQFGG